MVLGRRDTLSNEERAALAAVPVERVSFERDASIITSGQAPLRSCLLVEGFAVRSHKIGRHEQIISAMHVPGDFVDLHAMLLTHLDHDVIALGPCTVEFIDREPLIEITRSHPHLARLLWLLTVIDAKLHRVWIAAGARLTAADRIGHLLCELHARLDAVGLTSGGAFLLALEQQQLAHVLGYSVTHVNRSVQGLRSDGLLEWERGQIVLHAPSDLADKVGFSPDYLELEGRPR